MILQIHDRQQDLFPFLCIVKLKNDLLLRAARCEPVERTPVWLMRQAGRVLKEYREVREKAGSFLKLVKTPELAAEVTLQPVDIFGVDAAIIFSDILVIPEAMGLPYEMQESRGPVFPSVCRSMADLEKIRVADVSDLSYVMDAISLVKKNLNGRVPLIGFAGAPWTIFAYMTEGKGSKTFSIAKRMLYTQPSFSKRLLEMITLSTIAYLKAQVWSGADIVQLFDSWAGLLSPAQYEEFALPFVREICREMKTTGVPQIYFPKDAHYAAEMLGNLECQVVSLDWTQDIKRARKSLPGKCLQGNMDPCVLYAGDERIVEEAESMLREFGPAGHIANLGHGLYPDMDREKVKLFVDTVKRFVH